MMNSIEASSTPDENYKEEAPLVERLVFYNRPFVLISFAVITLILGYYVLQIKPEASFTRMIPTYNSYIKNYLDNQQHLKGETNTLRIVVESTKGDIFNKEYLDALKNITDEVFFVSGVDRSALRSLWMPVVTWMEITTDGVAGGPVIDNDRYDGSEKSLLQIREKTLKANIVGSLVANDFKSSIVLAALHDIDPETREPLDYQVFSDKLEEIRSKYQNDDIRIYIVGFAKIAGDLIDGLEMVGMFFFIALFIMLGLLYNNTRSFRVTILRGIKSMTAVIWQLGILHLLGYGLNPYSILVPFLIFAIGVSHGIQFFNAMALEMTRGADKLKAARLGYRLIYKPGLAALFTDCIGFAILMIIRIGVIQDIAIGASIGIAVVALTDLTILPVMMSYVGINDHTLDLFAKRQSGKDHPLWVFLTNFARPRFAALAVFLAVVGIAGGLYVRQDLKTGDLDPGAPELRPDSRYNLDNQYLTTHYSTSSDIFIIMVNSPQGGTHDYDVLVKTNRLEYHLRQLEGVQDVQSVSGYMKFAQLSVNEGSPKWMDLPRGNALLNYLSVTTPHRLADFRLNNFAKMYVYLEDHKAETLERVVALVKDFSENNDTERHQFLMAAGSAGIEAATNIEVEKALITLTLVVYAVVFLVCLITYRSFLGAICVVGPLVITSVLCEALMAKVGIGVKVATLPVIAVGVGIGVDYGIYIYNKLLYYRSQGHDFPTAYYRTLNTTGRAVSFTGITLAIGVATWAFSPIKFQADMGFLLVFMFLWNMVGAMVLLPALGCFLLKTKTT